jgi:D-alanyl-D-alanine dipeptidase
MSHRAGLIREPPAGHYFDDTGTDLATTVASLNGTPQIYVPGTRTKYSNAGIAVVGYTLEVVQGEPFADYVQRAVLEPLGMDDSAFTPEPAVVDQLADAWMWGFDRDDFPAPTFELGMAPAGSMYSTVLDLSRFMSAMFRGGEGVNGRVLAQATLERMWEPQFVERGVTRGYGLGFGVSDFHGRRRLGHGGAIYGFSTQLSFLPDDGLGVVVVSAVDGTNTVAERIASTALELMYAIRGGEPLPLELLAGTQPVDPAWALELEGTWMDEEGEFGLELDERNGRLFAQAVGGGAPGELRARGDTLITDDRLSFGAWMVPSGDALLVRGEEGQTLRRVPDSGMPPPPPARWEGLIVVAASVRFERRDVGTEAGGTFRIDPVRPVAELREEALAASPPVEEGDFRDSELVEVTSLEPGIRLDVRYATTNNFMSSVFYDEPRVFLQRPAAEGVARAHRALEADGLGLLLHDGYRPWYVTKMFWDATPESEKIFVANPANGSRHNRGSAIDLSLFHRATGEPVDMVGTYDEFSPRSFPDYPGGTSRQRWLRERLRRAMEAQGFTVYEAEWWHFDHDDWREYRIQNLTFDRIGGG